MLGFALRRTMTIAQKLYEAGYITYMRTDSTNLSKDAVDACRQHIADTYGKRYVPEKPRVYSSKEGAQEAHEAIRPSDVRVEPGMLKNMDEGQRKLYDLIRRFIACQMPVAEYDNTVVTLTADRFDLGARGRVLKFDGYLKVMPPAKKDGDDALLPELTVGDSVDLRAVRPEQHFTKPPARFNESSLVRELEKRGIGRPSTYAAVISTIQDRGYVRLEGKRMYAEKIGEIVTDRLVDSFPDLLNYNFTASMEENLTGLLLAISPAAELDRFYGDFAEFGQAEALGEAQYRSHHDRHCVPAAVVRWRCATARPVFFSAVRAIIYPRTKRCMATVNPISGDDAEVVTGVDEAENAEIELQELQAKRRCPICNTAMDSYLVDEERKLHVCGNNPDCPGFEVEKGHFKN